MRRSWPAYPSAVPSRSGPRPVETSAPAAGLGAFVRLNTTVREVAGLPGLRLCTGGDIMALFDLAAVATGEPDPPLPYWAYAWSGGLAIAHHLVAQPGLVRGRNVLDVASGSGLCAIVAMRSGARRATAIDVDPLAAAAIAVNARANHVRVEIVAGDILEQSASGWDVVLAGDVCYEAGMAQRLMGWLRRAAAAGATVLVGDPGRGYLPGDALALAGYIVRASLDVEESEMKEARVFTLPH